MSAEELQKTRLHRGGLAVAIFRRNRLMNGSLARAYARKRFAGVGPKRATQISGFERMSSPEGMQNRLPKGDCEAYGPSEGRAQ